jgi:hypothetical protein
MSAASTFYWIADDANFESLMEINMVIPAIK